MTGRGERERKGEKEREKERKIERERRRQENKTRGEGEGIKKTGEKLFHGPVGQEGLYFRFILPFLDSATTPLDRLQFLFTRAFLPNVWPKK
jgi:hypothetical protein